MFDHGAWMGIHTALATPFGTDGGVDSASWTRLIESQLSAGIHGLVVAGSTGEAAALEPEEFSALIESAVSLSNGAVPVTAGAGGPSTAASVRAAQRAEKAGAHALLCAPPPYVKPGQDGLAAHFAAIAEAVDLPIIAYNVPGRAAVDILPATLARIARIDSIIAVKDATGDLQRAAENIEALGGTERLRLLSGDDFTVFPYLALGGHGTISVASNVVPKIMLQLFDAAAGGRHSEAAHLQVSLMPLCRALFRQSNPIPVKKALELQELFNNGECRLPLTRADNAVTKALSKALSDLGAS